MIGNDPPAFVPRKAPVFPPVILVIDENRVSPNMRPRSNIGHPRHLRKSRLVKVMKPGIGAKP
jgi:hypothetical protein